MIRVPLKEGRTLHHDVEGRHGAGKVVMRTAPEGTGIIAGGPMRAVFEMLGIKDVVAKSTGTQNPYNMIRATMDGLSKLQSPRRSRRAAARRSPTSCPSVTTPRPSPARLLRRPETHGKNHRRQADRLARSAAPRSSARR
jgi:small subunit ribosomal protein S5